MSTNDESENAYFQDGPGHCTPAFLEYIREFIDRREIINNMY